MDYILLFDIIFLTSLTSTAVTFGISFRAQMTKALRLIRLIVFFSLSADLINSYGDYVIHVYIPHVGAAYRLLELIVVLEFYLHLFSNKFNRNTVRVLQVLLPVLFLFVLKFDATPIRITNSVIFSIYSISYFRKMMVEMNIPNPTMDPLFWVNSAILLYFSGVLFLFLFFEPLAKVNEASAVISYMFHNVLLVFKNALFAIGFWKSRTVSTIKYGK